MIYITGDMHGDYSRFEDERLKKLGKDDILIVCGDFGFIWATEKNGDDFEIRVEDHNLDELEKTLPYTLLFVDGNHENFDRLEQYPEVDKFGDKVHKIRENIYHLQRGRVYTIEDKRFFCFGGAASIDKYMRIPDISWWERELPNQEEFDLALENMKKYGYSFDYIITHTCPGEISKISGFNSLLSADMELTSFLSFFMEKCAFKRWFYGHFHIDEEQNYSKTNLFSSDRLSGEPIVSKQKAFRALYKDVVAITD